MPCSDDKSLRSTLSAGQGRRSAAIANHVLLVNQVLRATTVSDTNWDGVVITGDEFEALGTAIQDLMAHAELRNRTGLFEYRIVVQKKLLDGEWEPAPGNITSSDELLSTVNSNGYKTSASAFSDRTRLGYRIRLLLQYRAKATGGGAVGDSGELTVVVTTRFWCG